MNRETEILENTVMDQAKTLAKILSGLEVFSFLEAMKIDVNTLQEQLFSQTESIGKIKGEFVVLIDMITATKKDGYDGLVNIYNKLLEESKK